MPNDAHLKASPDPTSQSSKSPQRSESAEQKPWLTTPVPIKRLFDNFPLLIYPANNLPSQAPVPNSEHALYIFTTASGSATSAAPSFNPSCLKWQAYLKFADIEFATVASNNHASPTGALPFLLSPCARDPLSSPTVVPSSKLERWVQQQQSHDSVPKKEPRQSMLRYEAYMALLDYPIRHAWLYTLYLIPSNFRAVAQRLYIDPTSHNPFVRSALAYQLRRSAKSELLKSATVIDVEDLFREAEKAWEALSELLGDDAYFFAQERPGLFDAAVFAYTHLLLDGEMGWVDTRMQRGLRSFGVLVEHRERLLGRYF